MSKKVLLVADDDEMSRIIIGKFLGEEYEILEAENGAQALAVLQSTRVDILLLDILMPKLDGLALLKLLPTEPSNPDLAVLVATSTKEKTERDALALGADDVVSKPYDPVVIRKRLENILAKKELKAVYAHNAAADGEQLASARQAVTDLSGKMEQAVCVASANISNREIVQDCLQKIQNHASCLKQILS